MYLQKGHKKKRRRGTVKEGKEKRKEGVWEGEEIQDVHSLLHLGVHGRVDLSLVLLETAGVGACDIAKGPRAGQGLVLDGILPGVGSGGGGGGDGGDGDGGGGGGGGGLPAGGRGLRGTPWPSVQGGGRGLLCRRHVDVWGRTAGGRRPHVAVVHRGSWTWRWVRACASGTAGRRVVDSVRRVLDGAAARRQAPCVRRLKEPDHQSAQQIK